MVAILLAVLKSTHTHTNEQIANKPAQSKHKTVRIKPVILAWVTGSIAGVDATYSSILAILLKTMMQKLRC